MRVRGACILAAAVAAATLVGAGTVAAAGPVVSRYTIPSGVFTDDALCPFPVAVDGVDSVTEQDFPDGTVVFHDVFEGTASANGITIDRAESATITETPDGLETWKGLAEGYSYPSGAVIEQDTGKLVFDADGNIVSEQGPHPMINGDTGAVCAALGGS